MRLFGRKQPQNRCPDCRHYAMVEGYGYCAKALPETVNIRLLSQDAIRRQCSRCPTEMTCGDWASK